MATQHAISQALAHRQDEVTRQKREQEEARKNAAPWDVAKRYAEQFRENRRRNRAS
jgi:hypothetical protein